MARPGAALAGLPALGLLLVLLQGGCGDGSSPDVAEPGTVEAGGAGEGRAVLLYFPAASGRLAAESRSAPEELEAEALREWIVRQIVAGPQLEGLARAVPQGTEVAGVYDAPDGKTYVDLTIPGDSPAMGSTDELLAIYSLVNSVLLNEESADAVVLLVNGRQRQTFAGHVDTSRSLAARSDLIGES